jgi:hemoglobin-like flavoprotein
MNEQQIQLVQRSWRLLRAVDPVLVGGVFYDKLFADHPSLRRMFRITREEQSRKLIDMLNMIIARMAQPQAMDEEIRQMAIRHAGYGARPEHYAAVGQALMWTLEQGLGADWNEEVKEAWEACYAGLAGTMIREMD